MSEALDAAIAELQGRLAGADFDGSVKFDIEDEGMIRIVDGAISREDGDADVTITASLDTLKEMFEGELAPTAAYMTGKIKIEGDMGQAMKLSQFLG
ncbi:MAG: SCP2 sterol-binding domain-containing protein [Pseudomonadota bacterium]